MSEKITVGKPLVVLHGDEMAQIAFDRILEQFVKKYLDIPLVEIDLSAEKRLLSNGRVVVDAIEALKQHGVGIKNAGMTVNRDQLDELLARHSHIKEDELDRLATRRNCTAALSTRATRGCLAPTTWNRCVPGHTSFSSVLSARSAMPTWG